MVSWVWLLITFFGGGMFGLFLAAITVASHTKD